MRRIRPWLEPGSRVAVIGIGGLGQFAVQFLKLLTPARVIAIDHNKAKLAMAQELGADDVFCPMEAPGGNDGVLDFVGTDESLALGARLVARGGIVAQSAKAAGSFPSG